MATITDLAIKVSANISDLTKNINDITGSVDNMAKKVQSATPSMKNLEDAAQGYGIVLGAVNEAQKRLNDNPLLVENHTVLNDTTEAAAKLKQRLGDIGKGVAGDILKMEPTVQNIKKAQQQLEALKAIAEQTGETELFAGPIAEATANIEQLTANTVEAETAMASFKGVVLAVQNFPFLILNEILKGIHEWLSEIAKTFDAKFSGIPSLVLKVVVGFTGLVIVIGIANTQMMGLVSTTSVWLTMWKGSVIYKGLVGIIGLLNMVLGTQIEITAATVAWAAVITLGVAVIVAIVAALAYSWFSTADATDKAAEKTKMLQNVTESYKKSLQETVDEHKKMADTVDKIREASRTPEQKAAERAAELQNAIDAPMKLQRDIAKQRSEIKAKEELIAGLKKDRSKENAEYLAEEQKKIEELKNKHQELLDIQANSKPLTAAEADAQAAANRKSFAADKGFDISERLSNDAGIEAKITALQKIKDTDKQQKLMNAAEFQNAIDNMVADYRKAEGIDEMVKPFQTANDILTDKNKRLDYWLDLGAVNAEEYANGMKRAADDFAKSTGIEKFFDVSDTLAGRQAALAESYSNMAIYATQAGKTSKELADAQQKAAKAALGQSEHGKLLLDAMEAVRPATERLKESFAAIEAEAATAKANGLNVTQEAVEKAKAMAEEKIMGKSEENKDDKPKDNQALVRGSVAYTDYMNRDTGKDHLKDIRNNSKRQIELAEKQVEATRELGGSKQRIEMVS